MKEKTYILCVISGFVLLVMGSVLSFTGPNAPDSAIGTSVAGVGLVVAGFAMGGLFASAFPASSEEKDETDGDATSETMKDYLGNEVTVGCPMEIPEGPGRFPRSATCVSIEGGIATFETSGVGARRFDFTKDKLLHSSWVVKPDIGDASTSDTADA